MPTEQIAAKPKLRSGPLYMGAGAFAATLLALTTTLGHFTPSNDEHSALKERVALLEAKQSRLDDLPGQVAAMHTDIAVIKADVHRLVRLAEAP